MGLKVDTKHPEYLASLETWGRCRDFVAGSDAVKAAGEAYLPKLGGQNETEYQNYKTRAQFFNASGRTVDAMAGLVFRIDPIVKLPASLDELLNDVDYQGTSLYEFAKNLTTEDLTVGRCGILVDYPQRAEEIITMAQAQASGLRPYMAHYPAESILNWQTGRINGKTVLVRVVLQEGYEIPTDDEFVVETSTQVRVLDLFEGKYRQRLYRKVNNEWAQAGGDIFPLMANSAMGFIPFVFIGTETNTVDVQRSPIGDLVNVNMGHYRNSADHEHGLHFTAMPTPVITGHKSPQGEVIAIGSESFLVLSEETAKAYFMEFTGAGLEPIQKALEKKESQMATLGARMLADDKKGVEAAETARIHRSGEGGVLASLASSVSKGIKRALTMAAEWAGAAAAQVEYELNKDFMPASMDPAMVRELLAAWQAGGISMSVLFDNLKRGELIRSDVTLEAMQEEIDNSIPGGRPPAEGGAEGA